MIEDYLLNYGVLGAWTVFLIYEKFVTQKEMKKIIQRNSTAMFELKDTIMRMK